MEGLRSWTLSVCLACVAAGILSHLTAGKGKGPVIKLVLSLYILITALAPLHARGWSIGTWSQDPALPAAQQVDAQAWALDQAKLELEEVLRQALEQKGEFCRVDVQLENQEGQVTVKEVALSGAKNSRLAAQIVQDTLECETPVRFTQEDVETVQMEQEGD